MLSVLGASIIAWSLWCYHLKKQYSFELETSKRIVQLTPKITIVFGLILFVVGILW